MSNKPLFDANMRFLGYSSEVLRQLDERVYRHRAVTGEAPDEIRTLIYAMVDRQHRNTNVRPRMNEIEDYLRQRETRYSQKQQTAQMPVETAAHENAIDTPSIPSAEPVRPANEATTLLLPEREVWITAGGSHRRYRLDTRRLTDEMIEWRDIGPVDYKSKFRALAIPASQWAAVERLGFHKCRRQPRLWKGVD